MIMKDLIVQQANLAKAAARKMAELSTEQKNSALLTMADALEKISMYSTRRTMRNATEATAHMFIMCPFSMKDMQKLFSTHPSTEERVRLLREQAAAMKRKGTLRS